MWLVNAYSLRNGTVYLPWFDDFLLQVGCCKLVDSTIPINFASARSLSNFKVPFWPKPCLHTFNLFIIWFCCFCWSRSERKIWSYQLWPRFSKSKIGLALSCALLKKLSFNTWGPCILWSLVPKGNHESRGPFLV